MRNLPHAGGEFRRWRLHGGRVWRDTRAMVSAQAVKRRPPRRGLRDADAISAVTSPWQGVLDRLNVSRVQAYDLAERALSNGSSFLQEWLVSGHVSDVQVYRAIARQLGLEFLSDIAPDQLVLNERQCLHLLRQTVPPRVVPLAQSGDRLKFALVDGNLDIATLRDRLERNPALRQRLCVAAPSMLRKALLARCEERLLENARHSLFRSSPELSARLVANAWQGAMAATIVLTLVWGVFVAPWVTLAAVNFVASLTFCACLLLRLFAVKRAGPLDLPKLPWANSARMPVYTVLVALHKEREVLPQLLVALSKLQWSRTRLEIKLVCERDDTETLSVLKAIQLRGNVEIIEVPPSEPRTKPKALAYALAACSGEFVTLYDAEDRPHPLQLIEAWQRFERESDQVACLQAPLVVTNIAQSGISRMFAFEYSGLFRGFLPWLARCNLVTPLGGTSNHFRMSALRKVGGWDPYNVTEDAELGLRLRRYGYRTGTLAYPTLEDGPEDVKTWFPQRVRWFKGWLQTWLVHMRHPAVLRQELGLRNYLVMQVLYLGMVLSALVHPVVLGTLLLVGLRLTMIDATALDVVLLIFAGVSVAGGYCVFIWLGGVTLGRGEQRGFWRIVTMTPYYWLLLSGAAWRSLWEIYRRPHHWAKTVHRLARPIGKARKAAPDQGTPMIAGSSSPMTLRSRPS